MARGFLSGIVAGAIVSAVGLAALSIVTSRGAAPKPEAAAVELPAGSGFEAVRDDTEAGYSATADAPVGGNAPNVAPPSRDDLDALSSVDRTPARVDTPADADTELSVPQAPSSDSELPDIQVAADVPVSTTPATSVPATPGTDKAVIRPADPAEPAAVDSDTPVMALPEGGEEPAISPSPETATPIAGANGETGLPAVPAQDAVAETPDNPALPAAETVGRAELASPAAETSSEVYGPSEPDTTGKAAEAGTLPDAPARPAAPDGQSTAPVEADVAVAAPQAPTEDTTVDIAAVDEAPSAPAAPAPAPVTSADSEPELPAEPVGNTPEEAAPSEDQTASEREGGDSAGQTAQPQDRPRVGQPARDLTAAFTDRTSNRLPRVLRGGGEGEGEAPSEAGTSSTAEPPVVRFAEPIEADPEKPRMAIVLIETGAGPSGADMLDGLPFPVTVAIDGRRPDAAETAAKYRARGLEVLAIANLPDNAKPGDVEVLLTASLDAVPEALGVLEGDAGGLQSGPKVSEQVAAILKDSGHGLIVQPRGLNAAISLAQKEGVPAALVFRDFDGKGQDPRAMRRFLDQAAFKARQSGGVVMIGRLKPDTISALLLWALQDRAEQVALVPVSMLLK